MCKQKEVRIKDEKIIMNFIFLFTFFFSFYGPNQRDCSRFTVLSLLPFLFSPYFLLFGPTGPTLMNQSNGGAAKVRRELGRG